MVTQSVEHGEKELIEPRRSFPVRLATGLANVDGQEIVFELNSHNKVVDQLPGASLLDDFRGRLEQGLSQQTSRYLRDLQLNPDSPPLLNNMGLALLNNADMEGAIRYLRQAVSLDPASIEARANLIKAYTASGQFTDAGKEAVALEKYSGDHPLALSTIANLYATTDRADLAIETYTRIIAKNKMDFSALYNRGVQFLVKDNYQRAISDLRQAVAVRPKLAAAHNALGVAFALQGAWKRAIRHFEISAASGGTAEVTRNLSIALRMAGDTKRALEVLEHHLEIYAGDIETRERLASTLREVGRRDECLRHLSSLVKCAEDLAWDSLPRLYNNLGVVLAETGDFQGGVHYLEQTLRLSEDLSVAFENLMRIWVNRHELGKARKLYERYVEVFPTAFTFAMGARLAEFEGDYQLAELLYTRAIDADSSAAHGYSGLSKILIDVAGRPDKAVSLLHEGLSQCPGNLILMNNLAYAFLMMNDTRSARQILDRLQDFQLPAVLHATRGLLLIREGNIEEGSRLYNRASALMGDEGERDLVEQKKRLELARYWLAKGHPDRAHSLIDAASGVPVRERLFEREVNELRAAIDRALQ